MALQTNAIKNALADRYGATALFAALFTTAPGGTPGTEVTGGTPAYARKALTWSTAANGVITATASFDVPAGTTVAGFGVYTAATGGTYLDGAALPSQPHASQGKYDLSTSFTQS